MDKGFMKTVEVALAFILSFGFISLMTHYVPDYSRSYAEQNILASFLLDQRFRDCAFAENKTCIRDQIETYYPNLKYRYSYTLNTTENPNKALSIDTDKEVFVESVFISGNYTAYNPKIVLLYYWGGTPGYTEVNNTG